MSSRGSPSSRPVILDDVLVGLGKLRIRNSTPGGLPKSPASRVQAASYLDSKPLPVPPVSAQEPPPLPPRPKRPWGRPNPYGDISPFPSPPARRGSPIAMPDPNKYGGQAPHTQLPPPVSITYHRNPRFAVFSAPTQSHRFSTPGPSKRPVSPPATGHSRASSLPFPTTPTRDPSYPNNESVQCSGTTKAGKTCTRMVKSPHPLTIATDASPTDVARFCFQHIKDVLVDTIFIFPVEKRVYFDDWIPHYLTPDTRAALRHEMVKKLSDADEPGYIYAFELHDSDPETSNRFRIKVGRSIHMNKRLDQWGKQCWSKEVVLRGWWPEEDDSNERILLKGLRKEGKKAKYCHRLERLIHLELADLVVHEQYLTPEFFAPRSMAAAHISTPMRPKDTSTAEKPTKSKCLDCGTVHREIFTFTRVQRGPLKNREWHDIVWAVIKRWGKFVETYL